MLAYCTRAGFIRFHHGPCPLGSLPIAAARTDADAMKALESFVDLVRQRLSHRATENLAVPRDGDNAHRQGFRKDDNPFPAGSPGHAKWHDEWIFRHQYAPPNAADSPGGRLAPPDTAE